MLTYLLRRTQATHPQAQPATAPAAPQHASEAAATRGAHPLNRILLSERAATQQEQHQLAAPNQQRQREPANEQERWRQERRRQRQQLQLQQQGGVSQPPSSGAQLHEALLAQWQVLLYLVMSIKHWWPSATCTVTRCFHRSQGGSFSAGSSTRSSSTTADLLSVAHAHRVTIKTTPSSLGCSVGSSFAGPVQARQVVQLQQQAALQGFASSGPAVSGDQWRAAAARAANHAALLDMQVRMLGTSHPAAFILSIVTSKSARDFAAGVSAGCLLLQLPAQTVAAAQHGQYELSAQLGSCSELCV